MLVPISYQPETITTSAVIVSGVVICIVHKFDSNPKAIHKGVKTCHAYPNTFKAVMQNIPNLNQYRTHRSVCEILHQIIDDLTCNPGS